MLCAFLTGAAGYPLLELAARGRTHGSMALAGGLSLALMARVSRMRGSLLLRALLCGLGVTAIEYGCGRIWNRRWQVWDYRRQPLNIGGQICLAYTALWCALSGAVLLILTPGRRGGGRPVSRSASARADAPPRESVPPLQP